MRVAIYRLARNALLVEQGESVYNSKKLTYIISAMHGSEVEHLGTSSKVYGLIFHRPRIARASCIHCPRIGGNF